MTQLRRVPQSVTFPWQDPDHDEGKYPQEVLLKK